MTELTQNKTSRKLNFRLQNIESLIKFNLLTVNPTFNLENIKNNHSQLLNPLIFITNLKQVIRVLQFLKNQKNYNFYINTMDNNFSSIANFLFFFKKKQYAGNLFVNQSKYKYRFSNISSFKNKRPCLYLYVNDYSFTPQVFKSFFLKKFFMIYSINTNKDISFLGYYKFYGNLDEIKKVLFFSSLLKKFL